MFEAEDIKTVEGFRKLFGEPKQGMLMDLSAEFIDSYHRYGTDPFELVDGSDIIHWYNGDQYSTHDGTLSVSYILTSPSSAFTTATLTISSPPLINICGNE